MDIDNIPGPHVTPPISPSLKERVQAVDPNKGRCLIENCSSFRTVEFCHVVPRYFWKDKRFLASLEWYWNMRANTLNLDTRRNVFLAGTSVRHMYNANRWVLAPEDAIVQEYYNTLNTLDPLGGADRTTFPNIPDRNDFKYTLIPIEDMEDIAFSRQTAHSAPLSPGDFTTHVYPYDTLTLVSHIHPKFAIVAAGWELAKLRTNKRQALVQSFPCLTNIIKLYRAWTLTPPQDYKNDRTFWPAYQPSQDDDKEDNNEGDDPNDKDSTDAGTEKGRYKGT